MHILRTTAIEYFAKTFQLANNSIVNCMILDTPGGEKFTAIVSSYYRKADAVLLVYDISNKKTFNRIKEFYIQEIKERCNKYIPILLLGNKADLENQRQVSFEEAFSLALKENYEFKEISCFKYENVVEAFQILIEILNFENYNKNLRNKNQQNYEVNIKTIKLIKLNKLNKYLNY